ncbi:MAG: zinc/iron-chelating domain-containing protein [Desulfovibrio sp.]|jgi:hypothetical protein|nr:zinc/iron-chelating domain-containing protein [Desulfovibrio sp.]
MRYGRQTAPDPGTTHPADDYPCRFCALESGTCCRTDPKLADLIFPLSRPEGARLEEYGQNPGAFRAVRRNTPEFVQSVQALFPGEKARIKELFPDGGEHFSLALRNDGACAFLGNFGCVLPRARRPWYCLLFPVWVINHSLTLFSADNCLIVRRSGNPARAVDLMGESVAGIRRLFACLRRDWGFE